MLKQGTCSPGVVAFHSDDTRSSQNKLYRIEFQGNFHNSRSEIHQIIFNLDQMRCYTFAATKRGHHQGEKNGQMLADMAF